VVAWPVESKLQYRPMLASDLDRILIVENAAYPIPWTRQNFSDCLKAKNDGLVFYSGEHILGHSIVSYVLDEAHLLNVCIDPRYWGKGLGRFYLRHLIARAQEQSCQMFFLEVRASNSTAIHLYHSEGFNEVGIRKAYYPSDAGREDAILMTLDLSVYGCP
jgi:ribosomal-protein-alanine N-acetyltransferase